MTASFALLLVVVFVGSAFVGVLLMRVLLWFAQKVDSWFRR